MDINVSLVIVIICLAVTGIWLIAGHGNRLRTEQSERKLHRKSAKVKILQIMKSVVQVRNGTVIVKLKIEVVTDGTSGYTGATVWEVAQANLSQVQPGQIIPVKIDTDNEKFIYPNVNWAEFSKLYWQVWMKEE